MTFQFNYPVRNAAEVEGVAERAAVLKKHGRVEMLVGALAERTAADIPAGGSSWHDYTSYLSTWQKLFPHPKMQPFLDMEHVGRNRALLRDVMQVVRKNGYAAGLQFHTPFYLPEGFYERYPHLRGPRCDHPRRSRQEAFSLCVDHPETLQIFREMSAEVGREMPELEWMKIMTNDAGAGLCWSDWIYMGPNGPSACGHVSTAVRVKGLLDAIREGAGRPIDFLMNGNFSAAELREMGLLMGDAFHYELHHGAREDDRQVDVGGRCENPVKGILDPLEMLEKLGRTRGARVDRVGMNFRMNYTRGHDTPEVAALVIDVVDAFFSEPEGGAYGTLERLNLLRKICEKWVGVKKRDELLEAFVLLNKALAQKDLLCFRNLGNYMAVSMRHFTRPLVIMPELLTAEEEAYFLPHVFNVHVNEARVDYRDGHGSKMVGGHPMWFEAKHPDPRLKILDQFRRQMQEVAGALEGMEGTEAAESLKHMGMALRLYAGVLRSVNNCLSMGVVRDRNVEKLSGAARIPSKLEDWVGDPDLQLMLGYMRDELDNTAELVGLLEKGGMLQMLVADRAEDEDTFLLGPDLVGQLGKKMAIMRRHWRDVEGYMTSPHK